MHLQLRKRNFSICLNIGGRDQESTGFAWWAGNARLILRIRRCNNQLYKFLTYITFDTVFNLLLF